MLTVLTKKGGVTDEISCDTVKPFKVERLTICCILAVKVFRVLILPTSPLMLEPVMLVANVLVPLRFVADIFTLLTS